MPREPFVPKQYQVDAIQTLVTNQGAGLLLDPGMGKTVCSLMAFDILRKAGYAKTMLVIAPIKPMLTTWPAEVAKWQGLEDIRICTLHGDKKLNKLIAAKEDPADIYLINPEGVQWLMEHIDKLELPDILCVDESTKFKSSQAKRFKLLRGIIPFFKYRWILTGTFVPNGLLDSFSQVYIMDNGEALGKYVTHFKNKYGTEDSYRHKWVPLDDAFEKVTDLINHRVLRLDAEDHLEMPNMVKVTIPVTLPEAAMEVYRQVESDFYAEIKNGKYGGTITAMNQAAAGTKCRQIANGRCYRELTVEEEASHKLMRPVSLIHHEKTLALEELLDKDGIEHQKMLIVYEYKHDLEAIEQKLTEMGRTRYQSITGLSRDRYTAAEEAFTTPEEAATVGKVEYDKRRKMYTTQNGEQGALQYLLAHAGSLHGINIQAHCHMMTWYGITWNFEDYKQAVTRLYRQGQPAHTVMIYHIVADDTLDEKVVEVLQGKDSNQRTIEDRLNPNRQ